MKKEQTFEQAMKRLEEIAAILDAGSEELDNSIKLYEEGSRLIRFCQSKLNVAEEKIQKLTEKNDGNFETTPLDEES